MWLWVGPPSGGPSRCACVMGEVVTAEPWPQPGASIQATVALALARPLCLSLFFPETEPPGRGENFHKRWVRAELVAQQRKKWATGEGPSSWQTPSWSPSLAAPCCLLSPGRELQEPCPLRLADAMEDHPSTGPSSHKHLLSICQTPCMGQETHSGWPFDAFMKHLYIHVQSRCLPRTSLGPWSRWKEGVGGHEGRPHASPLVQEIRACLGDRTRQLPKDTGSRLECVWTCSF